MNFRNAAWQFLAFAGATATVALGVGGCDPRNDDINRVQPGYVRKAIFQTEDEWYYLRTVTHGETTNAYVIEGWGDWFVDRVKFKIQENVLIAYKPYEPIPGAGYGEWEGNDFFEGPVLAAWPITSHFDIIRGYDPATNLRTNIIQENAVDQVWYDREYMRVDWATNLVENRTFFGDYTLAWFPVSLVSDGTYWQNMETAPTDPHSARFSNDYVEYSTNHFIGMDVWTCFQFTGYSLYTGLDGCGYGEAKVRHSFQRIETPSDYIPREFPDSVVRKGDDGEPIYDDETGEVLREPIYQRFGIFRTETPTYDRGYGTLEQGRLFRAMNHNIWQRHTDDAGNVIPEFDRQPKPIIYWLNAEFPERYKQAAYETGEDFNQIFSNMVADLKNVSFDAVQQMTDDGQGNRGMFQVRQNSCNEDNIVSFVSENPDLLFAVERAVCTDDGPCSVSSIDQVREKVGIGNLRAVCTSLESATTDPMTGDTQFEWQRVGDVRYKMVIWLNNPQRSGWGGLGLGHADARTGETVSAHAYIRGIYYEIGAASVLDYIDLMNGELTVEDVIYGQSIRKAAQGAVDEYNNLSKMEASAEAMALIDQRLNKFGDTREERLKENPAPHHQYDRLAKVRGTRLEQQMINWQDIALAADGNWFKGDTHELAVPEGLMGPSGDRTMHEEIMYRASPLGKAMIGDPYSPLQRHRRQALGTTGACFLEMDMDPHWAGLAIELDREPDREKRFQRVAERLVKHVILHEIGHTIGLAHNFEGTYDALNYSDAFWTLAWSSPDEQDAGKFDEHRQTTVMEYMSRKGLFADRLGKYDEAAIRFTYGNQVSVFTNDKVRADLEGGLALREWRYRNDYMQIPDHICDNCTNIAQRQMVLRDRDWVKFDPQAPPQNEVPFLFCDNYYDRMTPFCATFDYGSNMREIFANYKTMWSAYYFFNNFSRERLAPFGWNAWTSAVIPIFYPMIFISTLSQYYYYLDSALPTEFDSWPLKPDMFAALGSGLNLAAEVVAIPEPVRMCQGWSNPTTYLPHYYFRSGCDANVPLDFTQPGTGSENDIQVPLGPARPSTIRFSNDYEEWMISMMGSYFDKANILWLLGINRPTLLRFNYNLDIRNYFVSLYRIFEPELRAFYDRLIQFDAFFLGQDVALDLGSYWCASKESPGVSHDGYLEPRRMIDVQGTDVVMNPGPPSDCDQPAYVYPDLLTNIPYLAMFYAHALFSSDFDSQLDLGKGLKVFIKGAPDDFEAWDTLNNCEAAGPGEDCYCSYIDGLTGVEYRGIQLARDGASSMSCRLIERATDAQSDYESSGSPFLKDIWRAWIERLEYARDLYRIYNDR